MRREDRSADRAGSELALVSVSRARPAAVARGLVAFVTILVRSAHGDWQVDATVRRTRRGTHALSFPARRDRRGASHMLAGPADPETRRAVEALVLRELGLLAPEHDHGGSNGDA